MYFYFYVFYNLYYISSPPPPICVKILGYPYIDIFSTLPFVKSSYFNILDFIEFLFTLYLIYYILIYYVIFLVDLLVYRHTFIFVIIYHYY